MKWDRKHVEATIASLLALLAGLGLIGAGEVQTLQDVALKVVGAVAVVFAGVWYAAGYVSARRSGQAPPPPPTFDEEEETEE